MNYRYQNPEVLYSKGSIAKVKQSDIDNFKQLASRNPRRRVRLCAHGNSNDSLHEMLIVHERSAYVRPHKHPGKTESTHIIEGVVDIVVFDDNGQIERVIHMGSYDSGRIFYCRMAVPAFHTLIIRSDVLVFHETTNGPFDRKDTVFAPWAPEDGDLSFVSTYMDDLENRVRDMQ